MKRLLAASILFIIITGSYLCGFFYINSTCDRAKELLKNCEEEYYINGNAEKSTKELTEYWQKKEKILSIFANHNEIDEIELTISTLKLYSKTENKDYFFEYCDTVNILIHQLMEDTVPNIHSIL